MTLATDALLARIEAKREEVTALTQALVRIPTVNPPGDAYEACARLVGERLSTVLKQPVVVENRAGANTRIASAQIAKTEPDGYTLLMAAAPHTTNPALFGQLQYDTLKDFTPISQICRS